MHLPICYCLSPKQAGGPTLNKRGYCKLEFIESRIFPDTIYTLHQARTLSKLRLTLFICVYFTLATDECN